MARGIIRLLMKLHGPVKVVSEGTFPVPTGAIATIVNKAFATLSLAHLIIWLRQEQRAKE